MSISRLLALTIKKFKSVYEETRIEFGMLTVFVGKNNSGKSTITQTLLLLQQTITLARVETRLNLDGYVAALNLRELTSGWPDTDGGLVEGPSFSIEWSSQVDIAVALESSGSPDLGAVMSGASLPWLLHAQDKKIDIFTRLDLRFSDLKGKVVLDYIELRSSLKPDFSNDSLLEANVRIEKNSDGWFDAKWNGKHQKKMEVGIHHFIPSLSINRRNVGPRDNQRSLATAFNILFAQPLDDLEALLKGFSYLSSTRGLPPAYYAPASSTGDDMGISGEFAAQLLYSHKDDPVHYYLPDFDDINKEFDFKEKPLPDAVNEVLLGLGIETPLSIHEIEKVGFRLLFGNSTLNHVGRGLTYLLPIVQLGLFSDPKKFSYIEEGDQSYGDGLAKLCAFEEPESHLHPKVQSRLASWFVALARARRQVIVETHSDHLVRRLRILLAQAKIDSSIELWLMNNIKIVSVSQEDGRTRVEASGISRDGGMEVWPADFMDAAVDAEKSIYYSALEKDDPEMLSSDFSVIHEVEDEPNASN